MDQNSSEGSHLSTAKFYSDSERSESYGFFKRAEFSAKHPRLAKVLNFGTEFFAKSASENTSGANVERMDAYEIAQVFKHRIENSIGTCTKRVALIGASLVAPFEGTVEFIRQREMGQQEKKASSFFNRAADAEERADEITDNLNANRYLAFATEKELGMPDTLEKLLASVPTDLRCKSVQYAEAARLLAEIQADMIDLQTTQFNSEVARLRGDRHRSRAIELRRKIANGKSVRNAVIALNRELALSV